MSPCADGINQQGDWWSCIIGNERGMRNRETHGAHGIKSFVVGKQQAQECQGHRMGTQVCHALA